MEPDPSDDPWRVDDADTAKTYGHRGQHSAQDQLNGARVQVLQTDAVHVVDDDEAEAITVAQ